MIVLPPDLAAQVIAQARADLPDETCGLLAGHIAAGRPLPQGRVTRVLPVRNAERSPTRYAMEPREQYAAILEIEDAGLELLGIYHSHTHSAAYPSATDIALATYPDVAYVLVSLMEPERPEIRAYTIRDGRVMPIRVSESVSQ